VVIQSFSFTNVFLFDRAYPISEEAEKSSGNAGLMLITNGTHTTRLTCLEHSSLNPNPIQKLQSWDISGIFMIHAPASNSHQHLEI
jgi:hypothetical protein